MTTPTTPVPLTPHRARLEALGQAFDAADDRIDSEFRTDFADRGRLLEAELARAGYGLVPLHQVRERLPLTREHMAEIERLVFAGDMDAAVQYELRVTEPPAR